MKMNASTKTKQINQKFICEGCGELFIPVRSDKRYCTKNCYDNFYNHAKRLIKSRNTAVLINSFNDNSKEEVNSAVNLQGLSSLDCCIRFLSQLPIEKNGTEFPLAQFNSADFNFLAFTRRYEAPPGSGFFVFEFGEFEITHIEPEIFLVKKIEKI